MVVLEGVLKFDSILKMLTWQAKNARHMVLVGNGRDYRLVNTQSKAASSKRSRPFLAQKSE